MAQSNTRGGSKKKNTAKANARFYVVKTVQEARDDLTGKLDDYNRKYIVRPLNTGRDFVQDLKSDPRKTVVNLIDDGKTRITHLNKDAWNRAESFAKDGRTFLTKAGKHPKETVNELMDDGRELVEDVRSGIRNRLDNLSVDFKILKEGIEKDVRLVIADVVDGSKKALAQVPGKQRIEEEISNRMAAIPAKFNLPSRNDIDGLVRRVKNLNAKVDALSKTLSA